MLAESSYTSTISPTDAFARFAAPLMHPFLEQLARAWPAEERRGRTILVAVSGGADSTALLTGLRELNDGGTLIGLHFHHGLRGATADRDAEFVAELCRTSGLACEIGRAAEGEVAEITGSGIEGAAREARYRFFADAARRRGARLIATGHTWDDQVETILHRLLRGTALDGLSGIPRVRSLNEWTTVIRPLLQVRRETIVDYLAGRGTPFQTDETNSDGAFTRNRIRHDLLPLLERDFNPRVREAVARLGAAAEETQAFVAERIAPLFEAAVRIESADAAELHAVRLREESPFVVRQILVRLWRQLDWPLREMSFSRWNRLEEIVREAAGGKRIPGFQLPGPVEGFAEDGRVRLTRR